MKRKIKKFAAAAISLLISVAAAGCSGTKETPPEADTETSSLQSDSTDAQAEFDFGETAQTRQDTANTVYGAPVRVEALGQPQTYSDSGILPPTDGAKLSLLITDDHITDYEAAAEEFRALGGDIKVIKAQRGELCGLISAKALSKQAVDIVQFDNGMIFPYGAAKGLIEPADLAVDMSTPKWDKVKKLSADFTMNNWHYVLAFGRTAETVLYYNKPLFESYSLDDPERLYSEGEWTTDRFCSLLREWREKGAGCTIAGHEFERGLLFGSGQTMVRYDGGAEGYSSNIYMPDINDVMGRIYSLKNDDIIGSTDAGDLVSALNGGVLFWSGTYAEGKDVYSSEVGAVPYPTLKGGNNCYAAKYDGLALVKGTKNTDSARAYFECALEQDHEPQGELAEVFTPRGKALYDFGMGISPMVSDSSARANGDYDKAIVPLLYSADPNIGTWDDICYYFSYSLHPELTKLNNELSERIFGNQN